MTNWRTSLLGVALIVLGIVGMKWGNLDALTGGTIITAGLGFLLTKDSQVTGGSIPQASPPGAALLSDALGVIAAVDALKKQGPITLSEAVAKSNAEAVVDAPPVSPVDVKLIK